MPNYNFVNRILIGDGTNNGTASIAGIAKGDLLLISENGTVITTNAAAAALPRHERITIAMGIANGKAILSSPIQGNTVSKYEGQSYVAPSERVVTLGFNGTSGALSVSAGTEYRLRIVIKDGNRIHGQKPTLVDYNYTVPTGGTALDTVTAIAKLFYQKEYGHNFIDEMISLDRISNGTFSALTNNATVTKGSKTVTSTAHGLSAGDVVRIGGTGATVAEYVVEEVIDANTFTLDIAYKGATATVLAANIGDVTAITSWGIKLSSKALEDMLDGYSEYQWVNFDAVFSEAADDSALDTVALFTQLTALNPGQGYWKQVRDREEKAKGYLGDTSKRRFYDKRIDSNVVVDATYDSIVITHADIHLGDFQDTYHAPLKTEIYIPDGSNQGLNSGNNFVHILNGYLSTVMGFTAVSF